MNMRRLAESAPGEQFAATIADISPGQVTLSFESGDVLTVKSLVLPAVRIGEVCRFVVTENMRGQILLATVQEHNAQKRLVFDIRV